MLAEKTRSEQKIERVTKAKADGNPLGSYLARLRTDSAKSLLWIIVEKPTELDKGMPGIVFRNGTMPSDCESFKLTMAEYGTSGGGTKFLDDNERISLVFAHGPADRIEDELACIVSEMWHNKLDFLERMGRTV